MKNQIRAAACLALAACLLAGCERWPGVQTTQQQLRQHTLDGIVAGKQTTAVTLMRIDSTEHAKQVSKAMIQQLRAQKSHTRGMPVFDADNIEQAVAYMMEHRDSSNAMMFASTGGLMQIGKEAAALLQYVKPIACIGVEHNYVIVRADSPWRDIEQLASAMRAGQNVTLGWNAQRDSYDSYYVMRFLEACRLENTDHIARTAIQENIALATLSGEVDVLCVSAYDVLPLLQNGELRALASMSPERFDAPVLRDVPTLCERGIDLQDGNAYMLFCPNGYPEDNENYWREQMQRMLQNADWLQKSHEMCIEPCEDIPEYIPWEMPEALRSPA